MNGRRRAYDVRIAWLPAILVLAHEFTQLLLVTYASVQNVSGVGVSPDSTVIRRMIELQALLPLPVLMILATAILVKRRVTIPLPHEKVLPFFLPVTLYAFLVGIIRGNPLYYVVGDAYQLLILPIIYWGFVSVPWKVDATEPAKLLFRSFFLSACVWLALEAWLALRYWFPVGEVRIFLLSTTAFVPPLFFFLIKREPRFRDLLFAAFFSVGIVLTFKRALYAGVVFAGALVLWSSPRAMLRGMWRLLIVASLALVLLVCFQAAGVDVGAAVRLRVASTVVPEFGVLRFHESVEGRLGELQSALKSLRDEGWLAMLLGMGLGALVETPLEGLKHTIHITWGAWLFRTGLIGTVVGLAWFSIFVMSCWSFRRNFTGWQRELYIAFLGWLILHYMVSFISSYTIWKDFGLAAVASVLGRMQRMCALGHGAQAAVPHAGLGQPERKGESGVDEQSGPEAVRP